MRVRATKTGFYGSLRQEGDEFDVPNGSKGSWFEPVAPTKKGSKSADSSDADKDGAGESQV